MPKEMKGRTIIVEDGNVLRAIKKLRRRILKLKILKTYNRKQRFTSKSYLRKKAKARKLFLSRISNDLKE